MQQVGFMMSLAKVAQQRISDLETDRDAWKGQATRLLTHQPNNSGGFFRRLFGK